MIQLASTQSPDVRELPQAVNGAALDQAPHAHNGAAAAIAAPAASQVASVDVAMQDWEHLFSAVEARLTQTAGELLAVAPVAQSPEGALRIHAGMQECLGALGQLHTTLTHELARRHQLELEIFDARTALAQARAELIGSRFDEKRARRMALHDGLTSLPNRSFFHEWLNHALAHAEPQRHEIAVLYVDLDGFKPINDVHGHDAGDELLRIVARRLARTVRAEDMVGRMGGDEFACLMAGLPSREALTQMACKLFDAVAAPVQIDALKISVRASIGIAMCPDDGTSAEALLKNADTAMYRAKRQHSGYAFFDEHDGSGALASE